MFLPWVEYEHNLSVLAATGMLTFMALPDYKPPLFNFQENEVAVPSVQVNLLLCRVLWRQVHFALPCSSQHTWGVGKLVQVSSPTISSRSEGLVLFKGSSPSSGFTDVSPMFHWAI